MKIKCLDAMPDLVDTDYVCSYLGCTKQYLYTLIESKKLAAFKVARKWRIPKTELKAYLKSVAT